MRQLAEPTHYAWTVDDAHYASHDGSARLTLASRLNELLDENGLSQRAAAQLLCMPQSKVSAIRNYKLRGTSLEHFDASSYCAEPAGRDYHQAMPQGWQRFDPRCSVRRCRKDT